MFCGIKSHWFSSAFAVARLEVYESSMLVLAAMLYHELVSMLSRDDFQEDVC